MKAILISFFVLTLSAGLMAQLSCYDIQYTENPSGDSPYIGQSVTVQGIVTAINGGSSFYIGDAGGGHWSGLFVYRANTSNLVEPGDMVLLIGTVNEYYGLTELINVSLAEVLSQHNAIPITPLSTADLPYNNSNSEPYEGVLIRFNDVQIKSTVDYYGQYKIADSSDVQALVDDTMYAPEGSEIVVGEWWSKIQGVVDYHAVAGYKVLPRDADDMIKEVVGNSDSLAPSAALRLNVYPNPFQGELNIAVLAKIPAEATVSIYNIKGQRLFRQQTVLAQGEQTISWDGRDQDARKVPRGIYLVKVKSHAGQVLAKVLRQ